MGNITIDYNGVRHVAHQLDEIASDVDVSMSAAQMPDVGSQAAVTVQEPAAAQALRELTAATVKVQSSIAAAVTALSEALEQVVRDSENTDQSGASALAGPTTSPGERWVR